ncbi:hypothetical protein CRE_24978 [Caenorhabditis remanei]|uniref:Uncharacterized protein n=1 Tax=Caenorhabditis remanei TaxID=31234 RepID=E3MHQ8_CAERE|nr:hypothetical protein CRE_24978 [Caenorhabditis remanei]
MRFLKWRKAEGGKRNEHFSGGKRKAEGGIEKISAESGERKAEAKIVWRKAEGVEWTSRMEDTKKRWNRSQKGRIDDPDGYRRRTSRSGGIGSRWIRCDWRRRLG